MKVLVVDDDPAMRRLIARQVLRTAGAKVAEAADGVAGLAAVESYRPDIVFTDVSMPHLDGLGLLQALRNSPRHRTLPVVAVSALSDKALVLRMVDLGIEDYLLKPLSPDSGARIDTILGAVVAQERTAEHAVAATGRPSVLLVDPDPGYGEVLRAALGERFAVIDGKSAAAALEWATQHRPALAIVASGQTLPSEEVFARTIRAAVGSRVLLLGDTPSVDPEAFDGTIARTFVPTKLREALEPALADLVDDSHQVRALLAGSLRDEFATACRQALGIVAGQDAVAVEEAAPIDAPVAVSAQLSRRSGPCLVTLVLEAAGRGEHALTADGEVADLLVSIGTTAVARLVHAFAQRGWQFMGGIPEPGDAGLPVDDATTRVNLRTERGAVLAGRLHLDMTGQPHAASS